MKNNVFDINRFWLYCKKQLKENRRAYLLFTLLVFGIFLVQELMIGFSVYYDNSGVYDIGDVDILQWRLEGFVSVSIVLLSVFAGSSISYRLVSKTEVINEFMTPASQFEKYMYRWLLVVPVAIIMILLMFCAADLIRYAVYSLLFPSLQDKITVLIKPILYNKTDVSSILVMLILQSFFILGAMITPKQALVRTFVAGLALFALYSTVMYLGSFILDRTASYNIFFGLTENAKHILFRLLQLSVIFYCWIMSYFRYKEMEEINRW